MSSAAVAQRFQSPPSPVPSPNLHCPKSKVRARPSLHISPNPSVPSPKMSQPTPARVTFPTSPNLLPPPYSHLPSPQQQQQQQQQQQPNSLSLRPTPPPSPLGLPPINTTLLPAHAPLSPRPSYPLASSAACPPYLYELAQADRRAGLGYISREPSLPSIMSMPRTRPASPDHIHSRKTSFAARRANLATVAPNSTSSPTSPQVSRRFFTPTSARGLSNLCMFEDGLQHYERVRSPSLRGHSRRGSLNPSITDKAKDPLVNEMFELDLSEDFGEETFRQARWTDDEDDSDVEKNHESTGARKLFNVGDRVGVGTLHQGYRVRDLFDTTASRNGRRLSKASTESHGESGILEVVRQIGVGSYAVVYLVREVLFDPALEPEPNLLDSTLSQTPKASDGFASLSKLDTTASSRVRGSSEVVYGRDFALKCLCKRNLSDELLVLQRGEAELHRSLPLHNNIVALHRALETPNWLFLVIEYCPGQDLFYWLEQARDSQDLESLSSRANSCAPHLPSFVQPHFHPVEDKSGEVNPTEVSLVPVNTPPSPSLLASTAYDEMLSRRRLRLISKMFVQMCEAVEACHQAGVCHRDIKPENFIVVDDRKGTLGDNWKAQSTDHQLGVRTSVTVKITDWGLGTSSKACEDFDCGSKPYMAYECRNNLNPTYDPVQADVWSLGIVLLNLLYHRCPWADPSCADPDFREFRQDPASFLQGRFEGMTQSVATFLAQNVFCEVGLVPNQRRISAGKFGEWALNLLHHMGDGQLHASVSDATIAMSPSYTRSVTDPRRSLRVASLGGLSKRSSQLFHPINLPPPVPEVVSPSELSPAELPVVIEKEACQIEKASPSPWPEKVSDFKELSEEPTEILADVILTTDTIKEVSDAIGEDSESCTSGSKLGSDHPKRRKRGARKGRKVEGKRNGSEAGYLSSTNEQEGEVDMLDGLAEASQSLAREISQATRTMKPAVDDGVTSLTTTKRKMNIAERMMEKFRDGSNPDLQAFVARARAREAAYMGKVNSNTASAPAQLQDAHRHGQRNLFSRAAMSTTSSSGIATTMTTSSTTSWGGGSDSSSFSKPPTHWSSASHRRERIQKTNPGPSIVVPSPPASLPAAAAVTTSTTSSSKSLNANLASTHTTPSSTATTNAPAHNKKEESKNKLAQLLTSFKRFNSTVGNHHSSSSVATAATTTTTTTAPTCSSSTFNTDSH